MVYISNPTEDGTLYTKEELTDLSATCYDCGLCLFVDGARMAYGLASEANAGTIHKQAQAAVIAGGDVYKRQALRWTKRHSNPPGLPV